VTAVAGGGDSPGDALAPIEAVRLAGLKMVPVEPLDPEHFTSVLTEQQMGEVREVTAIASEMLRGRTIWHVNSTDKGGGVAEMLTALLPYARGAAVDVRWVVIEGDPEFFRITKRIHNHLHGQDGDSPRLSEADRRHYEAVLSARAESLRALVHREDFIVAHDPQTAGLLPLLTAECGGLAWRCHVGVDTPNDRVRAAWDFLRRYVRSADAIIFSRKQFVWDGLEDCRVEIVAPSIDPFTAKNRPISDAGVAAILAATGLIEQPVPSTDPATFERRDGTTSPIRHRAEVTESRRLEPSARLVVQVSRWDTLKDPVGVLEGFRRRVIPRCDADLVLAGPSVAEVADDPEGYGVYANVQDAWRRLDDRERGRVHLASLPMDDAEENAAMVNALQRRAEVVVQKSLAEGFGLTVAEAMWKSRPVVASAVGGIQDQIVDGVSGVLIRDPHDLDGFGDAVGDVLTDSARAASLGRAAHERVRDHFLGTRSLLQYAELLLSLRR